MEFVAQTTILESSSFETWETTRSSFGVFCVKSFAK